MTIRPRTCAIALWAATLVAATAAAQDPSSQRKPAPFEVTIYPILVEAPIFGASISLPELPSRPDDGGSGESSEQSGSTGIALNAAYMAGVRLGADRWFGELRGTWAALSASRATPRVAFDSDTTFVVGRGGVRVLPDLWATGGFRRVGVTLDATLTVLRTDRLIQGTTERVLWDPLVGVEWRHRTNKLIFDAQFEGGGFGVGTDADVSGGAHVGVRLIPHTELRLGYTALYYKLTVADVSVGSFQRTMISSQSLHGPEIGLGIVF
jgi:hypothetical protein